MTPLLNQREGTPQFRYNEALCKARNCVERTFGVLKSTWRCLSRQRVLMYEPGFAGRIVNACTVLHNLSRIPIEIIENEEEETRQELGDNFEDTLAPTALAKRTQERLISSKFT